MLNAETTYQPTIYILLIPDIGNIQWWLLCGPVIMDHGQLKRGCYNLLYNLIMRRNKTFTLWRWEQFNHWTTDNSLFATTDIHEYKNNDHNILKLMFETFLNPHFE